MKFKDDVHESSGNISSENFIKLIDKQKVRGIFRGEPYDFKQHWIGNRSLSCTEAPDCPECAKGERPKFRFRINFIGKIGDDYVAKIFEQGARFYNHLKQLHESGYDLERTVVDVTRNGTGTNTNYSVLPVPNMKVDDALDKKLATVKLHDLESFKKSGSTQEEYDDIPF